MKKVIAGVVAGIVLGMSGTVFAASSYWQGHGQDYFCSGIADGAICSSGRYKVGITPSYVFIQSRTGSYTFACRKLSGIASCR